MQDLIYLIACAVHEIEPDDEIRPRYGSDEVYRLAGKQSISVTVAGALRSKTILLARKQSTPGIRRKLLLSAKTC